ncbi:DUF3305 domain-containing protein [Jannaschia sp. W003]|uniref:DUF3305 domain-containing protein n=1 Tax=Jannaschia sp. W003 TaxID=2867012 RepID=UPI0021A6C935|nr:DUF3305 domain-containing protein [Jannaschia sp. W003]UWQ23085.1 DUF3305 domain-containing protein [Jannaschia sp. W003]
MSLGIVLTCRPGVTRWARTVWAATGLLPGAGPADWRELRREGEAAEYHAATVPLELHGAETEAYMHNLAARVPSVWVVMREGTGERPLSVTLATVSPYEAQDYTDSGEELVEKIAMPAGLRAWVEDFCARFHVDEAFKKRRRDRTRTDLVEDGVGDARIAQVADVYRSPASRKARLQ